MMLTKPKRDQGLQRKKKGGKKGGGEGDCGNKFGRLEH